MKKYISILLVFLILSACTPQVTEIPVISQTPTASSNASSHADACPAVIDRLPGRGAKHALSVWQSEFCRAQRPIRTIRWAHGRRRIWL